MDRQLAVITGTHKGVGASLSGRLIAEGWRVVGVDRRPCDDPDREETRYVCDLNDLPAFEDTLHEIAERHGTPDLAVSNAGALIEHDFDACSRNAIAAAITTNLVAPIVFARAFGQRMENNGLIIFISSISATKGSEAYPVYASAKSGLHALTVSLAKRYGPRGVRVLAIEPGSIEGTGLNDETWSAMKPVERAVLMMQLKRRIPNRRLITPGDIATWVSFLAGSDSAANGSVIRIDGGELWKL